LLLTLMAVSAIVSASEAALLSVNKVHLRHLMEQGHVGAKLTYRLLTQMDHVIGTLLVANNLVNVAISAISSWIFVSLLGSERGLVAATIGVTVVLLVFCEVAPKFIGATHPEAVMFLAARPLRGLMAVLYPAAAFFTWTGRSLLRLLRIPARRHSALVTEEEIKVMIQMGREAGVLAEHELRLLQRIFEFSDSTVRDAMVPREDIAGIDLSLHPDEALDALVETGHSRIPVYRQHLDQIEGVIYARDVLVMMRHGGVFVLADLVRPVMRVPPERRLAELLSAFQLEKSQIAIVQDAQRRTLGLVTIEDLMEEIVGEIREDLEHLTE
jgi:CBS domain containing-hemolysin-like protein